MALPKHPSSSRKSRPNATHLMLLQEVSDYRLQGLSVQLIALLKNVTRRCVHLWIASPEYKALHNEGFEDAIATHKDGLVGGLPIAVKEARNILEHPNSRPSDKLAAATLLLTYGSKVADAVKAINDNRDEDGLIPIPREKPDVSK